MQSLLELNLSKPSKKSTVTLAVWDPILASSIKSALGISCDTSEVAQDLLRGIRQHATKLLKGLQSDDLTKAQLGLGHSYSRAKLKFNVNRIDNMIIQAIALLDQLDKDVNLFSMRIREWYGYHFPELVRIVPDNYQYAKVAQYIGAKETLDEEKLPDLAALLDDDSTRAQNILDAARGSMGSALSEIDMLNINLFATRVVSIAEYRKSLQNYLAEKMNVVAPSLTALLGERIGARLISHAGSLTNLSKYPASTVQILGAEKALFRALKTKGNTPKVWHLFSSVAPDMCPWLTFAPRPAVRSHLPLILHWPRGPQAQGPHLTVPREQVLDCIAHRLLLGCVHSVCDDAPPTHSARFLPTPGPGPAPPHAHVFPDKPSPMFGEALRQQVEERLNFFETGAPPAKNADAIRKVLDQLALDDDDEDEDMEDEPVLPLIEATPKKEKKKEKKRKSRDDDEMEVDEETEAPVKKQKLSKEEKKALRKEKKKQDKAAAEVRPRFADSLPICS